MHRTLVETGQHGLGCSRHMADAIVFAHECLYRVEAVEPHQSLELDLIAEMALHQIDVAETRNASSLDARDHFAANDTLVSVGILRRGSPAPETADGHTRIGMRT